jgi:hypothetical protein
MHVIPRVSPRTRLVCRHSDSPSRKDNFLVNIGADLTTGRPRFFGAYVATY